MTKLILRNGLSPGDILISTCAIRDLHLAFPGKYQTDIRVPTGCEAIFENNPYITKIDQSDQEARQINMTYSEIHRSGASGRAFSEAHTMDLETALGVKIPITSLRPEIYLSQDEKLWPSPVSKEYGFFGKYWVIVAGVKNDYTLKYYHRYQEVVNLLKDEIQFVQVGQLEHNHPALEGVIDMRGKTTLRELFRLSYHAEGSVNAVSLQMVIMAALRKPCVVVAGGREGLRWQINGDHRYLYTNGAMSCAKGPDGCWKSKPNECLNLKEGNPLCMEMIRPEDIARAIDYYYIGGRLTKEEKVIC